MGRLVCWFSCGATSAVAVKLALSAVPKGEHGHTRIVYIETGSEHPDAKRFMRDCWTWFGQPIITIKSKDYADIWDVFCRTRWLVGPKGARCSTEMKKIPRREFQQDGDVQVFGFDADEVDRAARFRVENPEVDLRTPLIDKGLTKSDCLAILERAGIQLPAMYRLGFNNANCLGCVKGGMGYWNRIRREFPETFDRMAKMEREIGAAICKRYEGETRIPVYLDELDPEAGRDDTTVGECSIMCYTAEQEIA